MIIQACLLMSKLHIFQEFPKCIDNASLLPIALTLSVDIFNAVCLKDALSIHCCFQKRKGKSLTFTESTQLKACFKKNLC